VLAQQARGAGGGRDLIIGIGLQDKGGMTSEETKVSTLGVHGVKQTINQNRIQKSTFAHTDVAHLFHDEEDR
jgi:hypothetical protein